MRPLRSECLAWVPDRDEGVSPPPQLGLPGQNLATWYVLSPLTSPKREMKGLAESPPGPWGQAGTAVPIHLPLGSVSGRFPWRGKALRQLLPCQLPTQSPILNHLVNLSLQTNLEDKALPVPLGSLCPSPQKAPSGFSCLSDGSRGAPGLQALVLWVCGPAAACSTDSLCLAPCYTVTTL